MVEPKTIYLEADEEVTSVIDKLRKTEFKEVFLVVPKGAGLLQSVVNLKLIKRQAENLGKTISVVTSDKVGRNLAEKVGLATAAKVGQEPKLAEEANEIKPSGKEIDEGPIEDTKEVVFKKKEPVEAIPGEDLIVSEDEDTEAEAKWHKKELEKKEPANLMPKFPKKKLLLIGIPVFLVILILAFIFLPRAKATIYVAAEKKPVSIDFTAAKDAKVNTDKAIIPAKVIETTKESTKKYTATGKKNVGTKASADLVILNGSGNEVTLATFSPVGHSDLVFTGTPVIVANNDKGTVHVDAAQPGDQYNGFTKFYAVKANDPSIIVNGSSASAGGTTKEVTFVTQSDINTAKADLSKEALNDATSDFNKAIENLKVVEESKKEETISVTSNPAVNGEGSNFDLTVKVSIKALAFNSNDVSELIKADVKQEFGYAKQVVDDGASAAEIEITSSDLAAGKFAGTVKTNAYVANKLDENKIKVELTGSSSTKATNYLKGLDGVDSVKLDFWPSFIKIFSRLQSHIYLSIQVTNNSN